MNINKINGKIGNLSYKVDSRFYNKEYISKNIHHFGAIINTNFFHNNPMLPPTGANVCVHPTEENSLPQRINESKQECMCVDF